MHTAAVTRWSVDVPLDLSANVSPSGAGRGVGQRFRHRPDAMDIPPMAGAAVGSSVTPRSEEAGGRVSDAMAISGLPGAPAEHLPPPAKPDGLVAMRRGLSGWSR